jgi:hypothetical protein
VTGIWPKAPFCFCKNNLLKVIIMQAPAGKREDKVEGGREKTKTTRREGEKEQRQRQMPAAKRWRERKGPSRV